MNIPTKMTHRWHVLFQFRGGYVFSDGNLMQQQFILLSYHAIYHFKIQLVPLHLFVDC